VYYLKLFFESPRLRYVFFIAALLAIIVLIRPVNGFIVFIVPFMAGDKHVLLNGIAYLKKQYLATVISVILCFAIIGIQLLIYKIQTGNFWIDSYPGEKFNWTSPHPLQFLFSYKKGLFLYTPLAFISLLGFYQLLKKNKFQFYSLLLFLTALLYILSAWWSWWYGGSFSTRVGVEYYSILALLLVFSYNGLQKKTSRWMYYFLISCCIIVCQIQTYQYRYYIIHWEKMDKAHYWNVFLRVDQLGKENANADLLKEL
jgi:hypothetical protein